MKSSYCIVWMAFLSSAFLGSLVSISSHAQEVGFTVTVNPNEYIVAESPTTPFSITTSKNSQSLAYSYHAYHHRAILAPNLALPKEIDVYASALSSSDTPIDQIRVYTLPISEDNRESLAWQHQLSLLSPEHFSHDERINHLQTIIDTSTSTPCIALTVLARLHLDQKDPQKAVNVMKAADIQPSQCWQLYALSLSTYFKLYQFENAVKSGQSFMQAEFNQAVRHLVPRSEHHKWLLSHSSASSTASNHEERQSHKPRPYQGNAYTHIELISTLGFSHLLYSSTQSSQSPNYLADIGKYLLEYAQVLAQTHQFSHLYPDIYNGLATYWAFKEDYAAAIRYLEMAIEQHEMLGQSSQTGDLLNNLALVYMWSGKWVDAQQTLRKAIQLAADSQNYFSQSILMANLAKTYRQVGDTYTAKRYYNRALKLSNGPIKDKDTVYLHVALARIYLAEKNAKHALLALDAAESIALQSRPEKLPLVRAFKAQALALTKHPSEANVMVEHSLRELDSMMKASDRIAALLTLCETQLLLKNFPEASKSLAQLSTAIAPQSPHVARLKSLQYQYVKSTTPEDFDALNQTFSDARKLINTLGAQLDLYTMGPHWFANMRNLYDQHLSVLLTQHNDERINDALILLDEYQTQLLFRKRHDYQNQSSTVTPELSALWRQRLTLETSLINAGDEDERKSLQQQLDTIRERMSLAQHTAMHDFSALHHPQQISLEEIQNALLPSQAVVRYIDTDRTCFVVAITHNEVHLEKISCPDVAPVGQSGAETTARYRTKKAQDYIPAFIFNRHQITDLIWVPDGRFFSLSLPQLRFDEGPNNYIGTHYTLRQVRSLAEYFTYQEQATARYQVSIFDAPLFQPQLPSELQKKIGWSHSLPPLPWAKLESDKLEALFSPHSLTRYSASNATTNALMSDALRQSSILHIATHSFFDPQFPTIVGLATAYENNNTGSRPGFISQTALLSQPFHNQLVVLSGCETALGQFMSHDGYQSLAYGMLSAGARSVISTDWKVSDKPTAIFMGYFYQALLTTQNTPQALLVARRKMQQNPRFKHPNYWASFRLSVIYQASEQFDF